MASVSSTSLTRAASALRPVVVVDPSPNALFGTPSPKSPESNPPSPSYSPDSPSYTPTQPASDVKSADSADSRLIPGSSVHEDVDDDNGVTHDVTWTVDDLRRIDAFCSICTKNNDYICRATDGMCHPALRSDVKSTSVSLSGGGCGRGLGSLLPLVPAARHCRDAADATAAGCEEADIKSAFSNSYTGKTVYRDYKSGDAVTVCWPNSEPITGKIFLIGMTRLGVERTDKKDADRPDNRWYFDYDRITSISKVVSVPASAAAASNADSKEDVLPVAKPVLASTKRSASAAASASAETSDDDEEDPDFIPLDPKTEELNPANTPEENEMVMRFFSPNPAKRKAADAKSVSVSASAAAASASEDGAQPSSKKKAKADSTTSAVTGMTDTGRIKDIGTLLTATQEQALYDAMDKERKERCVQNRHVWCNCVGPFSLNPDSVVTWADLRARELLARD